MKQPTRILFVCHGNICRSVMAEMMMKDMAAKARRESDFYIDSAATSTEEIGSPIYPPARRKLREKGIDPGDHRARQVRRSDYDAFDMIIGMDGANIRNLCRLFNGDPDGKVFRMMSFASSDRDISDPWYTDDFESTYRDLRESLDGLMKRL
ncbi:MAG: low molecular weight phosphotyrosine protein phosphatase [Erysipelotrichaceae bacterium]|nr:low molecular weight phosphotyrosine protein phosphatase [Erysipelotrichaceae bacterium]